MPKLDALIAGSNGYIGIQLVKLLIKHPNINIKYLCGNTSKGKSISYFDKSIKNLYIVFNALKKTKHHPSTRRRVKGI